MARSGLNRLGLTKRFTTSEETSGISYSLSVRQWYRIMAQDASHLGKTTKAKIMTAVGTRAPRSTTRRSVTFVDTDELTWFQQQFNTSGFHRLSANGRVS
jgi:hypothetical protein